MRFLIASLATVSALFTTTAAAAREPAPIEYAGRAARPSGDASSAASSPRAVTAADRRATAAALNPDEALYGYGRAPGRNGATIDLRGRLAGWAASPALADDAFEPPSLQASVVAREGERGATVVEDSPSVPPVPPVETHPTYFVQVGAFANVDNAERARASLADLGPVKVDLRSGAAAPLHRVRVGRWETREEAERARAAVAQRGFAGAVVGGGL
jgi:hypothetical protein